MTHRNNNKKKLEKLVQGLWSPEKVKREKKKHLRLVHQLAHTIIEEFLHFAAFKLIFYKLVTSK